MDAQPAIRRATPDDVDVVATVITLAFARDPLWSAVLARSDGGTDHVYFFWRLLLQGPLRYPNSWITENAEATSVWIPPGGTETTSALDEQLGAFVTEHLGPSAAATFVDLLARFEAAHPHDVDHYYLSLLGTHPDHRGRGIGMALLAHNLRIIDEEHTPAYLESSNPANIDRYRSVGFEPCGEFAAPVNGTIVTTMWRPAR